MSKMQMDGKLIEKEGAQQTELKREGNDIRDNCLSSLEPLPNQYPEQLFEHYPIMTPPTPRSEKINKEIELDIQGYEAEVKVYRALEKLKEDIIVIHSLKYTQSERDQLFVGEANDGDCDFVIVGRNYCVIFEVKQNKADLKNAKPQADQIERFISGIVSNTSDNSVPQIFKFGAFPFSKNIGDMTKQDLENDESFNTWWRSNVTDKLSVNKQSSPLSEETKNVLIDLWAYKFKKCHEKERCGKIPYSNDGLSKAPDVVKDHVGIKYFTAEQEETFNSEQELPPRNVADNLGGLHGNNLMATAVKNGRQSIYRLRKLILIFCVLLNTSQCCEQTCYSAYKDGSLDLQEVRDGSPTIVPINFTGVVTIEAAYIPGYKVGWEYIRFMKNEDLKPLVLQFYTPNDKYNTTLTIFGEDEIGVYPDSRYSVDNLFTDSNDEITIQVSDVHVTEDNFYRIYLGEPGKAHSSNYSYQNKYNWEEIRSFMSFNTTTQIKTDNKAIYFKSVSVCSDDTLVLCGESVETVARSRGEAFNLSCSAYGAPYLEAVWSNVANVRQQLVHSEDGFLQTSTVSVDNFNENHTGVWTCYWRNKNLGTVSGTKIFVAVELVSKPANGSYFTVKKDLKHGRPNITLETNEKVVNPISPYEENHKFKWVIKNKLSEGSPEKVTTLLNCKEGDSAIDSKHIEYEEDSTVSERSSTLILPENIRSDYITCTLYLVVKSGDNGTERLVVLDTTTYFREGYKLDKIVVAVAISVTVLIVLLVFISIRLMRQRLMKRLRYYNNSY